MDGDPYIETGPVVNDHYYKWLSEDLSLYNSEDHWVLLHQLYCKPFYYIVEGDSKLVDDALELRGMYESAWKRRLPDDMEVNVLEILRYLSIRMSCMVVDYSDKEWFWIFMHNLKLDKFDDFNYCKLGGANVVNYRLAVWLTREYSPSGSGGLFPLSLMRFFVNNKKFDNDDQSKLSIYEQAIAYARTEFSSVDISVLDDDDTTWEVIC